MQTFLDLIRAMEDPLLCEALQYLPDGKRVTIVRCDVSWVGYT